MSLDITNRAQKQLSPKGNLSFSPLRVPMGFQSSVLLELEPVVAEQGHSRGSFCSVGVVVGRSRI